MDYQLFIEKFKPIFVLHEDEEYLPLSFPTYVKACNLVDVKNNKKLVEYPSLTAEKLVDSTIDPRLTLFQRTKDISLQLVDESVRKGTPLDKDVDIYVFVNEIEFDNIPYIDVVYNILYGYNGFKNMYTTDVHNFDSEFATVRIKKDDLSFNCMFFSAHGDGQWYKKEDVYFKDERPVAFIANGSHSIWPTQGKQIRFLGFGDDYTTLKPEKDWRIFDPKLVSLTSFLQNPFPSVNYSYMAFVGSVDMENAAMMPSYDNRVVDSINYTPRRAAETSGIIIQSKVDFNIKNFLYVVILILTILDICLFKYRVHVYVIFIQLLLAFIIGFIFAYIRLLPSSSKPIITKLNIF